MDPDLISNTKETRIPKQILLQKKIFLIICEKLA
ncbi:hypothetical protein LYNGBM3L_55080 [Moorena producens 3L]|uniref:Uncharacterized protein n=1 Tax=Moorena producens 3L TaxID=489825 RepID=F4XR48_9CYAN|nr:hypothetical protein LYNGBM3L_55080 [Moorena producens 3L]